MNVMKPNICFGRGNEKSCEKLYWVKFKEI